MSEFNYKLYLVTDQEACLQKDFFKSIAAAVKGGVDIVQIREKKLDEKEFLQKTLKLKELLDKYGVPLIVNDSLPIAIQSKAAGIHVGNSDLSPMRVKTQWPDAGILGYSLEHIDQLSTPNADIADYIALSPVFSTVTKKDTITEWGLEGIKLVRSLTPKPLVAIGNVHAGNAADLIKAGVNCLAVISAILSVEDPERAAARIRNEIEKASQL